MGLHSFAKHTIPSKCRHCRHACYFHAVSCVLCGVVCHKRCTELLQVRCKLPSAMPAQRRVSSVFGSPLAAQFRELEDGVPIIVRRIINSIERRGLCQEGLYRLTGVKSHVEQLCADFETNPRSVDVDKEDVHVLTAVLKLYFRQLPEPVVPTPMGPRFLQIAKDLHGHKHDDSIVRSIVDRTRQLVEELPKVNHDTLAFTIIHLAKISQNSDVNKMKPSNLGIVFGPTLLRSESDTLDTLMDMPHQTVMAELMIEHYPTIFARYVQEHSIVYQETPAMRRVRRRYSVEPVYASVPELSADLARLSAASPPPVALSSSRPDLSMPAAGLPALPTPLHPAPPPPSRARHPSGSEDSAMASPALPHPPNRLLGSLSVDASASSPVVLREHSAGAEARVVQRPVTLGAGARLDLDLSFTMAPALPPPASSDEEELGERADSAAPPPRHMDIMDGAEHEDV